MDRNQINVDSLNRFLLDCQLTTGALKGGLRDGYKASTNQYQFLYTETTGYLVTYFVNLYRATNTDLYKRRAVLAADFLVDILAVDKLPYNFDLATKKPDHRCFVFDNAICVQGLVDIYQVTHKKVYLHTAEKIAGWITSMQQTDGSFRAYYDTTDGSSVHAGTDFSADGGCIQIKNAIAFLKLFEATKNNDYKKIAEKILDKGQIFQLAGGGFRVNKNTETVFSHGHCYATEGYLYGWEILKKPGYLETVKKAAVYLQSAQHRNGGISQRNQTAGWAADATSQAVRIWQSLDNISDKPIFAESTRRALRFLKDMESPVMKDKGQGIYYTKQRLGRKNKTLYTWVTMFCASAVILTQVGQFNPKEIY